MQEPERCQASPLGVEQDLAKPDGSAEAPGQPGRQSRLLLFVRRLHTYLGIALVPWFFMYAAGAAVLNHRQLVGGWLKSDKPEWTLRFEREYSRPLPATHSQRRLPPEVLRPLAAAILDDLGLGGRSFWTDMPSDNRVNIHAFKFLTATRVTWFMDQGRVRAEDQRFSLDRFLVGMHERGGFEQQPWLTKAWGVIVDLVALSLLTWVLSGLYVWWKGRRRHLGGGIVLAAGLICFVVLVLWL